MAQKTRGVHWRQRVFIHSSQVVAATLEWGAMACDKLAIKMKRPPDIFQRPSLWIACSACLFRLFRGLDGVRKDARQRLAPVHVKHSFGRGKRLARQHLVAHCCVVDKDRLNDSDLFQVAG